MVQPRAASKDLTKSDVTFTQWTTEKRIEYDPKTMEPTDHWYARLGYSVQTDEGETIPREMEVELKATQQGAAVTMETFLRAQLLSAEGITG